MIWHLVALTRPHERKVPGIRPGPPRGPTQGPAALSCTWVLNGFKATPRGGVQLWLVASQMHGILIPDQSEILHAETPQLLRQNSLALRGQKNQGQGHSAFTKIISHGITQKKRKGALIPTRVVREKQRREK